jgi:hypothetical protein
MSNEYTIQAPPVQGEAVPLLEVPSHVEEWVKKFGICNVRKIICAIATSLQMFRDLEADKDSVKNFHTQLSVLCKLSVEVLGNDDAIIRGSAGRPPASASEENHPLWWKTFFGTCLSHGNTSDFRKNLMAELTSPEEFQDDGRGYNPPKLGVS